jgi:hypothetical protein
MRVLLAGASGFIGSELAARLQREGHTINRIVRRDPGPGDALLESDPRHLDLSRLPGGSLTGIDAVFSIVGEPLVPRRWGPEKREAIRASRIQTTDLIARAIAAADEPPPVFVSMSAVGYYGDRGDEVLDEGSSAGSGFVADLCRSWEAATSPARERGVRVAFARSGIVLGAGGGVLATLLPLFRYGLGARLGNGRQWTSWISRPDAVSGLLEMARNETLSGAVNLVGPNPVRNATFTSTLGAVIGRPALLTAPRAAIVAIAGRRVADEFVLASARVLPKRLEAAGMNFEYPELTGALAAALTDAGMTPRT